jgi:hypothetical protein
VIPIDLAWNADLKLIQPQHVTSDPGRVRQKAEASPAKPVVAVEAVEKVQGKGSYSSTGSHLPGKFVERHERAIHSYLNTASLDADGGELIGIDTYA